MERNLLFHELNHLIDATNREVYVKTGSINNEASVKDEGPIIVRYTDKHPEVQFVKSTEIGKEILNISGLNAAPDFVGEYIKIACARIEKRIELEFDADNAALQNVTESVKDIKDVKEIKFNFFNEVLRSAVIEAIKFIPKAGGILGIIAKTGLKIYESDNRRNKEIKENITININNITTTVTSKYREEMNTLKKILFKANLIGVCYDKFNSLMTTRERLYYLKDLDELSRLSNPFVNFRDYEFNWYCKIFNAITIGSKKRLVTVKITMDTYPNDFFRTSPLNWRKKDVGVKVQSDTLSSTLMKRFQKSAGNRYLEDFEFPKFFYFSFKSLTLGYLGFKAPIQIYSGKKFVTGIDSAAFKKMLYVDNNSKTKKLELVSESKGMKYPFKEENAKLLFDNSKEICEHINRTFLFDNFSK